MGASIFGGDGIYGGTRSAGSSGPSGSGTLNYIAKWTPDGTTLGNSQIFDDGTNVGIGTAVMANYVDIVKSQNDVTAVAVTNANTGTTASACFFTSNGTTNTLLQHFGTNYTTSSANFQNGGLLRSSGAGGLSVVTSNAAGDLRFYVGSATAIKARILATNGYFGVNVSPTATIHTVGASATSADFAFKAENSSLTNLMSVRNDGLTTWGTKMIWNNASLFLSIDGTGAAADTLQVTSTISNTGLFSNFGSNNLKAAVYARTENATAVTPLWSVWEQPSNSSYISLLKLFNRASTGIGIGAGAGIDYAASNSGGANPINYAQHGMVSTNITAASEAGYLFWKVATAGALANVMAMYSNGIYVGGIAAPTAKVHLAAGTATASTAPLKFTSGTNLATPEAGAFEFDGTNFYATPASTRGTIALWNTALTGDNYLYNQATSVNYSFIRYNTSGITIQGSGTHKVLFTSDFGFDGNYSITNNAGAAYSQFYNNTLVTGFAKALRITSSTALFFDSDTPSIGCSKNIGIMLDAYSLHTDSEFNIYKNNSTAASLFKITEPGLVGIGTTPTAFMDIAAGVAGNAQIRLRAGVAPSSPNDGDFYYVDTNDRFMVRKNTLDSEILSASAVTTEAVASDTTLTITYNGTTYKLLARA